MKQFGESTQNDKTDEVPTRAHGEFANTSNPWLRIEAQESREVAEMQKRKPGLARRQGTGGTSMVSRLLHHPQRHMG